MDQFVKSLEERRLLSAEQAARFAGQRGRGTAVRAVIESGLVDQQILASEICRHFGLAPAADWPRQRVLPDRISLRFMREHRLVPLAASGGRLTVAVSDPTDADTIAAVRLAADHEPVLAVATDNQILSVLERLGEEGAPRSGDAALQRGAEEEDEQLKDLALDAPAIDLVNRLFRESSASRATDLHVEAGRWHYVVRRRVDGLLKEADQLPPALGRAAVSRIKILSQLNIAERRLPQDGRARLRIADRDYDIRVATMPTIHGENVAIRFLSSETQVPELMKLGLSSRDLRALKQQAASAHGMIAVTGPTGSGKTTTLAAVLSLLNDPRRKILTIEDPVEYQIEGVNQIQVHPEIGLTFARTLRSLLRFDPDIIMVGEMRDGETASIGVNAALTGHLVLTTLHTNSAAGAVTRLLDLGVQAYLIGSTLRAAVGQRLVRRLCPTCREPFDADPSLLQQLPPDVRPPDGEPVRLWKAVGCDHCGGSGYQGRAAIFEVLVMDEALRSLVKPGTGTDVIAAAARAGGMTTMMADGFAKCREGVTTLEELARVAMDA